ncbi:MAG: XdhC family protein [Coriobacteriales bacterium]|jgi:xanthine dehydrogenase accessory factor|nr:XdhC family protein [Coriobacteriales bacterium]
MERAQHMMRETLTAMIASLEKGEALEVGAEDFARFAPEFTAEQLADHPAITPRALDALFASLTASDIPTLTRALRALDEQCPSWLGFKLVTDPEAAVNSEDTDVVGIRGEGEGSADGEPGIFFATEDKELVFSRPYSNRDRFQMLDITRGPHMHNEQYAGVAWLSIPLEQAGRAFIFGAGEVPLWVARMAKDVGFASVVLDDDEEYLNAERFPHSELVLVEDYEALPALGIGERDYVLVLTRGHMHDPEALMYGINTGAHYVGMMGCATKNERVFAMAKVAGISTEQLEATHSPIGLKFGAKTPPELALCIVAEIVQDRAERRKSC